MNLKDLNVEPTHPREFIWEQMFRPSSIADVALPDDFRSKFESFIEAKRIPSMIFYSPKPGTGKTTTARALSNDIGCKDPLFINASLNNSIENIRSTVQQYGSTVSIMGDAGQKVVILDECERLSPPAQESLKGLIEELSRNCSFILTTNDINRVNGPLLSRCRRFDFIWSEEQAKTVKYQIVRRAVGILNNREIPFDNKAVMALITRSFPDNRNLLGTLQNYSASNGKIDSDILNHQGGFDFNGLVDILAEKDFKSAAQWSLNNFEHMGSGIFGAMYRFLCPYGDNNAKRHVNDAGIPALTILLNDAQKPQNLGVDGYVHLLATLTEIMGNPNIKIS